MVIASLVLAATVTSTAHAATQFYDRVASKQLVPMLAEVVHFRTVQGNDDARLAQQKWLLETAARLGFTARDAGKVTEIELPATIPNAPILGLVVHGDVQPVDEEAWSFKPFEGIVKDGYIYGRGTADDKGPLVQALLAMQSIKERGPRKRTHTIRLLVGSDEESTNLDIDEYLKGHKPPDYSLELDSDFPVDVGEKAWQALTVTTAIAPRGDASQSSQPYEVIDLKAGLATSIVPDHAEITLRWLRGDADWSALTASLPKREGYPIAWQEDRAARTLHIVAYGKSAHAGENLEGGRNALVSLARALEGKLPPSGARDLLDFARQSGQDFYGTGLGITDNDPVWGRYAVNVATIKMDENDPAKRVLTINIRRIPPRTGPQLEAHLRQVVDEFNASHGSSLVEGGFFADEPLAFDPQAKIVKRLLRNYAAATGEPNPKPAISGGGTYAKRLPNSIAFGMWFPGKPYPGHDLDERVPLEDLHRGTRVLIRTLVDFLSGPRMDAPFKR